MGLNINSTMGFIAFISVVVISLITAYNNIIATRKKARTDENDTEDRVIGLLKDQVDALEKRTGAQEETIKVLEHKVSTLENNNKLMRELLTGVDKDSLEYRKQGLEAMKKVAESETMLNSVYNGNKQILESIEKLYSLIEQHLQNEAKILQKQS